MKKYWKLFPYVLIAVITVTLILLVLQANNVLEVNRWILLSFRLLSVALLFILALRRKSLTTWILVCMVAGAEFGYDVPLVAKKLQVFSDIFLDSLKQ